MLNIILSLTFAIALCTTTETTAATRIPNDLNITDTDGNTMLHHACYTRDEENISALITTQNIKQKNNDGNTPLGIACKFSIPGTAIQLLNYIEAGDKRLLPILNTKNNDGNTPLHEYCGRNFSNDESEVEDGHAEYLDEELLIKLCHQDNINAQNHAGLTPLHIACREGNYEVINARNRPYDVLPIGEEDNPAYQEVVESLKGYI